MKNNKSNENSILADIFKFCHLLCADPEQIKTVDFSQIFAKKKYKPNSTKSQIGSKLPVDKIMSSLLSMKEEISKLINEINSLKIVVN